MNARFRFLAALLALFAFSASLAEPVWAAACAPAPAEAPAPMAVDHESMPEHGALPAPDHDASDRGDRPRESGCPLHAAASAGCAATVVSAAETPVSLLESLSKAAVLPTYGGVADLLLASGPFHPPQR